MNQTNTITDSWDKFFKVLYEIEQSSVEKALSAAGLSMEEFNKRINTDKRFSVDVDAILRSNCYRPEDEISDL